MTPRTTTVWAGPSTCRTGCCEPVVDAIVQAALEAMVFPIPQPHLRRSLFTPRRYYSEKLHGSHKHFRWVTWKGIATEMQVGGHAGPQPEAAVSKP